MKFVTKARAALGSAVTKVKESTRKLVDRLSKNRWTKPLVVVTRVLVNVVAFLVVVPLTMLVVLTATVILAVALVFMTTVTVVHKTVNITALLVSALLGAILGRGTSRYELQCAWAIASRWTITSFGEATVALMGIDITAKVESVTPPVVTVETTPRKPKHKPRAERPRITFGPDAATA
jgi:hypothetical protein